MGWVIAVELLLIAVLTGRAVRRATKTFDRILEEELDR